MTTPFSQIVDWQLEAPTTFLAPVDRLHHLQHNGVVKSQVPELAAAGRVLAAERSAPRTGGLLADALLNTNLCVGEQDSIHAGSFAEKRPVPSIGIFLLNL
jgi:hypothetical protein